MTPDWFWEVFTAASGPVTFKASPSAEFSVPSAIVLLSGCCLLTTPDMTVRLLMAGFGTFGASYVTSGPMFWF